MRHDGAETNDGMSLRYAQCWEDADILMEALDVRPGHVCLTIASGGDNALAMLAREPDRVVAVDTNPAQLACLELRVAAYRRLSHRELLELVGSLPSARRGELYRRCRGDLSPHARRFWDDRHTAVRQGIGGAGRFEEYFALFRSCVLPLIHGKGRIDRLLQGGTREHREALYRNEWDTWRWRLLFRAFFSRFVMARLGRDPSFFRYVTGGVARRLMERVHYGLTGLNPAENPYLQWILTGRHATALPYALRPENFDEIRDHLDRLEWHCCSVEDLLDAWDHGAIDRFNLSDIFEYMPVETYHHVLGRVLRTGCRGGRLAYWNMLVERRRPDHLAHRLRPLTDLALGLSQRDKAFFYGAFIVEEIL